MEKLANHTALKEWSTVVAALGSGEQIILIRKGGIADASFGIDAERFYLYPTYFHQGESEARSAVTITHWCEVVRTWTVRDFSLVERLGSEVVMPHETLAARYRFRRDQALYVVAVRTWELATAAPVRFEESYGGCKSWISVEEEIDIRGSRAVLSDEDLASRVARVGSILAPAASLAL